MTPSLRIFRVEFSESQYIDLPAASKAHALRTAQILKQNGGTLFFCENNYAPNSWIATPVRPETPPQRQLLTDNLSRTIRLLPFTNLPIHVAYPLSNRIDRSLCDLASLTF